MQVKVNKPQGLFLKQTTKFRAFVGGYGSGKTWVGCTAKCMNFFKSPKQVQGYFGPTYPHIRDIFFPTIEEVAHGFGLRVDIKEANKEVHYYRGPYYMGTTICRSMDRPQTIVGFKIGHALVDELDVLRAKDAKVAFQKIIARMRVKFENVKNGVDVTTTPEGFKETHRLFVEQRIKRPDLAKFYSIVHASTYDNRKNLPEGYIESLRESYPSHLIEAYLMGQFVNLTSGTVYRNYNRVAHNSSEVIKEGDVLRVGMDFNVGKMAATIYVVRPNGWHAVAELKDLLDTPDMIQVIVQRWPKHNVVVYPDASGSSRSTKGASKSDLDLLRLAKFEVKVNSRNPAVKDRVNSTNKQFESGRFWVNAQACPTVASCLERQAYDDNGEPDKKSGFDHQNDATTYPIAYEFPVVKPVQRIIVAGA